MPETQTGGRTRRTATRGGTEESGPARTAEGGAAPICTVAFCPICLAVTAAQGAAPDAVDHLLKAAREFFLAARAVMDARAEDLSRGGDAHTRLERIDIA